jgi:signal transduction histidine kinase/PAS domain-containing protein
MRLSIKTKQVLGVTSTVGAVVVALSVYHLATLARVSLEQSDARAKLVIRAIYQRAQMIVPRVTDDQYAALEQDGGLRAILEASMYSPDVTDAAIVTPAGIVVAHNDREWVGLPLPERQPISVILELNSLQQLWTIFTEPARTLEVRDVMTSEQGDFATIRIGISTLLVRDQLGDALDPAITTVLLALVVATGVAMLLAQLFLRPIHVLKSGLTRLQRGETGITLDLPQDEFGDLGTFFSAVSDQLSADRSALAGQKANLETVVERLEDAIAVFNARGEMLFANPAMRELEAGQPEGRWRELVQNTVASRQSHGPLPVATSAEGGERQGEWLLMAHPIEDVDRRLIGVMLMARNVAYLSQVQSTLRYSRKLTALGKLSAGVAHEVKNPLNAMMIHLELLRQKLSNKPGAPRPAAAAADARVPVAALAVPPVDVASLVEHVNVIAAEIKRLDQVLQGFLKFARPEDLRLQPVRVGELIAEVATVIEVEARRAGVQLETTCGDDVPDINGDAAMLRQALLNLGINATQAMPSGGVLRFRASALGQHQVEVVVEDTGVGIKPEHLQKIFDLYFTTREKGSGIGLSMVYRTVQLHDGEIEVRSTPGVGTTFRLLLPRSPSTGYLGLR